MKRLTETNFFSGQKSNSNRDNGKLGNLTRKRTRVGEGRHGTNFGGKGQPLKKTARTVMAPLLAADQDVPRSRGEARRAEITKSGPRDGITSQTSREGTKTEKIFKTSRGVAST